MPRQAWQGSSRRASLPRGWARLRAAVLMRDKHRCTEDECTAYATNVDHVVPHHLGGTDTLDNLTSLCAPHHQAKSSREGSTAAAAKRADLKRPAEQHPGIRT
jgi:5-methylcytosine-specific restriction protein A